MSYYTLDQLIEDAVAIRNQHGGHLPIVGSNNKTLKNIPLEFSALPPHGAQVRVPVPGAASMSDKAQSIINAMECSIDSARSDISGAESEIDDACREMRRLKKQLGI